MASAGYNPRIAVEFWKIASLSNPDISKGDLNYPSFEERANFLAQAHGMEHALTIYKEDVFKVMDEVYNLWLRLGNEVFKVRCFVPPRWTYYGVHRIAPNIQEYEVAPVVVFLHVLEQATRLINGNPLPVILLT
ncbi:hypothetical protein IFM89_016065 [Coptis chinensis]|uniref:Uncharacterized protein n=1 Tax=Coptis chinensis TaxID=261450 RepID=A0A835HMQ3_9MAGN|nr:hypothetical protein IFM89_016065 [Coptis chinensis]